MTTSPSVRPARPSSNAAPSSVRRTTSGTGRSAGPSDTTNDTVSTPVTWMPGPGDCSITIPRATRSEGTRSTCNGMSASSNGSATSSKGRPTASGISTRFAPLDTTILTAVPSRTRVTRVGLAG